MSQPPPDLFPERPVRSDFARAEHRRFRLRFLRAPSYRARRVITVSVIVIVLIAALRVVFSGSPLPPGEIATIKAPGSWKQRPDQPGGLDIPNQNVEVYQSLDSKNAAKPPAEHLLPPPEVPQPASSASASSATAAAPSGAGSSAVETLTPPKLSIDSIPTTVTPSASIPAPTAAVTLTTTAPTLASPAAAPPTPVESATMSSAPSPAAIPASPVAAAATAKPAAKSKPPMSIAQVLKDVQTAPKTDRIVQLASVPDEATARTMADRMQTRYASILGSAQLRLVKADVPGKGVYYRIQSQPIAGDHASGICAALKRMKAGCILVRP